MGKVAAACGFSSLYAFSRAFKHQMGLSPKGYRALGGHSSLQEVRRRVRPARANPKP